MLALCQYLISDDKLQHLSILQTYFMTLDDIKQ